jgi:predicted metallo-beta-lactamase superfamily hydrolase
VKLTDPVLARRTQLAVHHVAFDSFGVMAMCARVETPEVTITVDPGVSAAPEYVPLPRDRRRRLLADFGEQVARSCAKSQAIAISHYHLDHFTPERDARLYSGKVIFAKALDDLPPNQTQVARRFFQAIDGLPAEVVWADGRRFRFGRTEVGFSGPLWHGASGAEPGRVIITDVRRGRDRALVASDVAGPTESETTDYICQTASQHVILDGYPTWHIGQFATDADLVRSIINTCRILASPGLKSLVVDHHLARDYRYPAFYRLAYARARALKRCFGTAAELAGNPSAVLEGYRDYGPSKHRRWSPLEATDARSILDRAVAEGRVARHWLAEFDRWVGPVNTHAA